MIRDLFSGFAASLEWIGFSPDTNMRRDLFRGAYSPTHAFGIAFGAYVVHLEVFFRTLYPL